MVVIFSPSDGPFVRLVSFIVIIAAVSQNEKSLPVCVARLASDNLWHWNMAANDGSYKETQGRSSSNGKGYTRKFLCAITSEIVSSTLKKKKN